MFATGWSLRLVALSEHASTQEFRDAVAELPVRAAVSAIPMTPGGQALSALAAGGDLDPTKPFAVWNADTHLLPGDEPLYLSGGNWLTVAELPGDHWSFAAVGPEGNVTRTTEKVRISDWASIGLYGFTDFDTFAGAVASSRVGQSELYIAPLYNSLLEAQMRVESVVVRSERVVPFGTPNELVRSCQQLDVSIPKELSAFAKTVSDGNSS